MSLPVKGQKKQRFIVGFRSIQTYDTLRRFDTTRTDSLRFRPVKIDLFYPATQPAGKAPLPYQFFLNLYARRIDFQLSADSCQKVGDELAQYYSRGVGLKSPVPLATLATQSYLSAPPTTGRFPLVIYCPGYNGMSYENTVLLEHLVQQGYRVAAISSIGKYPGYMTMDPVDILEQVQDARFVRRYLQPTLPMLSDQVALIGYSWGGLAASMVGMQEPNIQAVVSLDGNDRYSYGSDPADDQHFTHIRQAAYFQPQALRAPYLYVSSGREDRDLPVDSVFVLASAISSTMKHYVRLPATTHEDFSCLPYLATQLSKTKVPASLTYPLIEQLILSWLASAMNGQESKFEPKLQQLLRQHPSRITLAPPLATHLNQTSAFTLRGSISDTGNKPLAYVNMGILGGNQGTVSQSDGSFHWSSSGAGLTDTVRLSLVGYESRDWPLSELIQSAKHGSLQLTLKRQVLALPEIVIKTNRPIRRTLGNATQSRLLSASFGGGQCGSQIGIRVKARRSPTYIEKVNFHVSYNRYDSLTIRLNIYQLEDGVPAHNLLTRPVLVRLGNQTGRMSFDLSDQPLAIAKEVLVALEVVDGQGGPGRGLYLSAGLLTGSTYYRRASQGHWRQSKGMGAGIQVSVQY